MKDYIGQSRRHFDKQAKDYDANDTVLYSKYPKISCRDAENYLKDKKYKTLLDIGCGTGWMLKHLSEQHPAEYYGLDLSEEMLKEAAKKNIPGVHLVQGTSDALPYEDNTFDIVTCIQSFHHYPDGDKAMQEAYRVLKPGGIYLLSDTGVGGLCGWIDNKILFLFSKSGDCHSANKREIAGQMRKNGFKVTRCDRIAKFIYTVVGRKPINNG